MQTYVGIILSLLGHLALAAVIEGIAPKNRADFGTSSGPIIVRLQKEIAPKEQPAHEERVIKNRRKSNSQTVSELPKGFDQLIEIFVAPDYPLHAIRKNWEGKVLLELTINKEGIVEQVGVRSSSGHGILDSSATKAAVNWKFKATGSPSKLEKEIIFQLR